MKDAPEAIDSEAGEPRPWSPDQIAPLGSGTPNSIAAKAKPLQPVEAIPAESGGPAGPEPTRFGDWERNGRCIDF